MTSANCVRSPRPESGASATRRDLRLGAVGALLVCLGGFGMGDLPRNSPVVTDSGLAWVSYGHGKTLSAIVFWCGVAAMAYAWVRLGRRIARVGDAADADDESLSVSSLRRAVLLWAAPLVVTAPLYSRDVYAYLAQSAVLREGFDPYTDGPAHYPGPLLDSMAQVWTATTAPYGPLFMGLGRAVVEVTGDHVILGVLAMRLVLLPGLFLSLWAIPRLATHFGASPQAGLWLALLNPMVLIHLVGGPHVELLMMGVLVAGVVLTLRRRHVAGLAMLGVAASIKITAGIAIPFVVWIWLSHLRSDREAAAGAITGPAAPLGLHLPGDVRLPMGVRLRVFALVAAIPGAVFGVWTVLLGLGFGWLHGLGWADRIINWFTVPTAVAHLVTWAAAPFTALNLQEVLPVTRGVGAVCLALILVGLWWWGRRDERSAVVGMVWAMVAVLLLEPSTLPWYYTWALCLAAAFTLTDLVRTVVVGVSTFMLVVFQPDDSIWFYRPPYLIVALSLSALAAVSLTRRDPLRLGRLTGPCRRADAT